jgi:hypothetical protein
LCILVLQPGEIYTLTVGTFSKYPYTPNFFNETGYRNGDLSVIPDPTLTGSPPRLQIEAAPPKGTKFKYVGGCTYVTRVGLLAPRQSHKKLSYACDHQRGAGVSKLDMEGIT